MDISFVYFYLTAHDNIRWKSSFPLSHSRLSFPPSLPSTHTHPNTLGVQGLTQAKWESAWLSYPSWERVETISVLTHVLLEAITCC